MQLALNTKPAAGSPVSSGGLVSVTDYAKQKGLSKQAVSKALSSLIAGGLIAATRDGGKLLFDPGRFEALRRGNSDPARLDAGREASARARQLDARAPAPVPSAPDEDGEDDGADIGIVHSDTRRNAKTAFEIYRARQAELDYKRSAGELVERAAVERATVDVFQRLRDRLLGVSQSVAERSFGQAERDIALVCEEEIGRVMDEFAAALAAEAVGEGQEKTTDAD